MMSNRTNDNYFFACTGLQVVNAIEYIYHADINGGRNVLVIFQEGHNIKELESVIGLYQWRRIVYLPPPRILKVKNESIRFFLSLFYSLIRIKMISFKGCLIVGNDLNPYYRYAVKRSGSGKVVFIDDGAGSVHYDGKNPYLKFRGLKQKFMYKILGLQHFDVVPEIMFSAFELENFAHIKAENQILIRQSYSHLCRNAANKPQSKTVYFIGDPIVHRGYISLDKYLFIIDDVKKSLGMRIVYIPRMFEDESMLQAIAGIVEIQRNPVPFEVFMANVHELPSALIGFHSSVLFNVHSMYGNLIDYYFIKLPDLTAETHREKLTKIWASMSQFAKEFKPDYSKFQSAK